MIGAAERRQHVQPGRSVGETAVVSIFLSIGFVGGTFLGLAVWDAFGGFPVLGVAFALSAAVLFAIGLPIVVVRTIRAAADAVAANRDAAEQVDRKSDGPVDHVDRPRGATPRGVDD